VTAARSTTFARDSVGCDCRSRAATAKRGAKSKRNATATTASAGARVDKHDPQDNNRLAMTVHSRAGLSATDDAPAAAQSQTVHAREPWRALIALFLCVLSGISNSCVSPAHAERLAPRPAQQPDAGAPSLPSPTPSPCVRDSECGWDNACLPSMCVAGGAPRAGRVCDESGPEPGSCRCSNGVCTLERPQLVQATSPETGCNRANCGLSPQDGRCHVTAAERMVPVRDGDRYCSCDARSDRCVAAVQEPVPCQSWRDCSWADRPFRVVHSRVRRRPVPRPVRPCRDGEFDTRCVNRRCVVVRWGC